jgi:hypothetical protein
MRSGAGEGSRARAKCSDFGLAVVIPDDEAGVIRLIDGPWWRALIAFYGLARKASSPASVTVISNSVALRS